MPAITTVTANAAGRRKPSAKSGPREFYRCAIRHVPAESLIELGATPGVIDQFGAPSAADLIVQASSNFDNVWKTVLPSRPTRYSDGSYPVLYTATRENVARTERSHWAIEGVFRLTPATRIASYFYIYRCRVSGRFKDHTKKWRSEKRYVHPSDYSFCHNVGHKARRDGLAYILVPSARHASARCAPVFVKSAARAGPGYGPFHLEWDAVAKTAYAVAGTKRTKIVIHDVYGSV